MRILISIPSTRLLSGRLRKHGRQVFSKLTSLKIVYMTAPTGREVRIPLGGYINIYLLIFFPGGKSTPIQGINGCISGFPYGQKILNPWWVAYQNNGKWEGNPQKILGALPSDGSFPAVAQSNSANNLIASGTDAQEPGSSTQGNPVNQATQEIPENQDLNLENPTEPSQETEPSQQAEPSQQTKRRRRAVHS